jgi:hypothetical protein
MAEVQRVFLVFLHMVVPSHPREEALSVTEEEAAAQMPLISYVLGENEDSIGGVHSQEVLPGPPGSQRKSVPSLQQRCLCTSDCTKRKVMGPTGIPEEEKRSLGPC